MSELTARERLADAVEDAMIDGWHALEADTPTWKRNAQQSTEAILAIVREALLSEQAKEAASYFASYYDIPVIVDSLLNAGLGTRFVTDGYDEPLG